MLGFLFKHKRPDKTTPRALVILCYYYYYCYYVCSIYCVILLYSRFNVFFYHINTIAKIRCLQLRGSHLGTTREDLENKFSKRSRLSDHTYLAELYIYASPAHQHFRRIYTGKTQCSKTHLYHVRCVLTDTSHAEEEE